MLLHEVHRILNGTPHFIKLPHNPNLTSEYSLVSCLSELKKKEHLDNVTYQCLSLSHGSTPRFQCLSQICKPNCPLLPIISFTGFSKYNLPKYLVVLVIPVTRQDGLTLTNTKDIV